MRFKLNFGLVPAALALAALSGPTPAAFAQTAVADQASEKLEEVVVTGSRIASPNAASSSPIQVVSSKDIQLSGKTDISDILMQLPQNFDNGLGQDLGNRTSGLTTAGGVATADLRGLGPNRTLVLVDGRRLGIGSPFTAIQSPAPDLDQIPAALVERVEVVTGGASATYGSDAIAGVINFIMKKNFQGFEFDGQLGVNMHKNSDSFWQQNVRNFNSSVPATGTKWDGHNQNFNIVAGTDFAEGRGNVSAYMSYLSTEPVAGSERDWSSCQANEIFDPNTGDVIGAKCGGSSNSNYFKPKTGPHANTTYSVFGTDFVKRGSVLTTPPASFNSQPYIYMTRQDRRYSAGFMAHMDVNDHFKPYAEVYFMDDQTHQQIAPAALFRASNPLDANGNYNINCSNPLLSSAQAHILCTQANIDADKLNPGSVSANVEIGRRNIEGGGRFSDYQHTNYRAVTGSSGDISDAFTYDAYAQYYYVDFFNSNEKYENFQSITNALQVTGTAANPVCIGGGACVPYNIFKDGGVTADQLNYLYLTGTGHGYFNMRTLHGEITGQLGKYGLQLPTAREGVALNFGYEHRREFQNFAPDSAEQSGLLSGAGAAQVPLNIGDNVSEEWLEARVPLVQDRRFAKDLLFDTAVRRSDYSITGVVNTYKFETQWAPVDDFRLRATYQQAIRAPSIIELFNPQNVGLVQLGNDPCAATDDGKGHIIAAVATLQQCQNSGVTAAQYGNGGTTNTIPQASSGQLSQLTGGNQQLQAEKSKSWTLGVTFSPRALPHLTGSIDYFHIKLDGTVGVIPAATILNGCILGGDLSNCGLLVRSPGTGGLVGNNLIDKGYIVQTNVNAGAGLLSGTDFQANYKVDLSPRLGSLAFALNGSLLQNSKTTPFPGAHTYDCKGLFGITCQTVNPKWHHILRMSWQTPWDVTAALTWRYIGSVSNDNNSDDPTLHFAAYGAYDFYNATIPSFSYIDLAGTWNVRKNLELRAGVSNITDKDPPRILLAIQPGGANTYSAYDQLGRQLFLAFTARL